MGRVSVAAFSSGQAAASSGASISLATSSRGQYIRIGLTLAAQEKFFGRELDAGKDGLEVILSDDAGKVHLIGLKLGGVDSAESMPISKGARGAVSMKLIPWRQVAGGKRPATSMAVVNLVPGDLVSLKLPEWARLEARKIGQGRPLME
ncbi:MAG: hypothetical protein GY772_25465 [bacterium]|nr:hypothetical protein [bacterium]